MARAAKMNILVVNDDGVDAVGIHRLAKALTDDGHTVYVCAPARQQSATGHGITIGRLVYMDEVAAADFPEAAAAVAMDGTPADCVKFGLELYQKRGVRIEAVFSGFNHGMNLGTDTLYSGTVSAAVEGAMCGLPAAALSISSNMAFHRTPLHFAYAMKLAQRVADWLDPATPLRSAQDDKGGEAAQDDKGGEAAQDDNSKESVGAAFCRPHDGGTPPARKSIGGKGTAEGGLGLHYIYGAHTILNVNVPDLPEEEIKGVLAAPLSYREYEEWFDLDTDEEGREGYRYSGRPKVIGEAAPEESDIVANGLGYATVTPLQFDLTSHALLEKARKDWDGIEV